MKVKCISVRLKSLTSISDKAYKAVAFDGSEAILPKSQVFGQDYEVSKCDAYWISEWILEKKELQYTTKKSCWIDTSDGESIKTAKVSIVTHVPHPRKPIVNEIDDLKR